VVFRGGQKRRVFRPAGGETMRWSSSRVLIVAFFLVAAPASLLQAANLVTFTRGQSIVVQSVEKRGAWYYFVLEGGGEMGVPASRVVRIEEYEAPPPSVGVPAAVPPPNVPPPSTSQQPAISAMDARATGGAAGGADSQTVAQTPPPAPPSEATANVLAHGDDWRYKARMSGGPKPNSPGGMRKPGGMAGPMGGNRLQGGASVLGPMHRRPPVVPPEQPSDPQQ